MNSRFIIITTCYNVEPFIKLNIYMNKFQSYTNALFVYVDDNSKDNTYNTLLSDTAEDARFLVLQNKNNGSQGKAFLYAIKYLEQNKLITDEDILVEVDGDDWLSSTFVLQYLAQIYTNPEVWMTFGQYQIWPSGSLGGHYSMSLDSNIDRTNSYRNAPFAFSHLKTYKYWLFNKIDRKDLIDPLTGEIFAAAWDHALCLPMVEMAGMKHIHRCEDILYNLNRADNLQNEGKSRVEEQKQTERRIRERKAYQRL